MTEERKEQANKLLQTTGVRVFEIVQYCTSYVEGDINDWPANIQDVVFAALEQKAAEVELPLVIVVSYCDKDIDNDKFFIRVIASEVVAAYEPGKDKLH